MNQEIGCDAVRAVAFELRRGELGQPNAAIVAQHVTICGACAAYLTSLDRLLRAPSAQGDATPEVVDALWHRIEEALPEPAAALQGSARRVRGLYLVGLAAAALLVAVVGWLGVHDSSALPVIEHARPALAAKRDPALVPAPAIEVSNRGAAPTAAEAAPTADEPAQCEELVTAFERPPDPVAPVDQTPRKSARTHAPERRPTAPTPAPPVAMPGPPGVRPRLSESERLQREGRLAEAAQELEAMLEEGALKDVAASSARLDLARLHERLGRTRRAAHHLRELLRSDPDDPAAASVFRELCRLSLLGGVAEPMCPLKVAATPGTVPTP